MPRRGIADAGYRRAQAQACRYAALGECSHRFEPVGGARCVLVDFGQQVVVGCDEAERYPEQVGPAERIQIFGHQKQRALRRDAARLPVLGEKCWQLQSPALAPFDVVERVSEGAELQRARPLRIALERQVHRAVFGCGYVAGQDAFQPREPKLADVEIAVAA